MVASRRKNAYSAHWFSLKLSKTNCKTNVEQCTNIQTYKEAVTIGTSRN